jgi:hypothetical protein
MDWFRRGKSQPVLAQPRPGIPIDLKRHGDEIGEGTRPGLPHDGRYWVSMIESYDDEDRLIWEKPATHKEAKAYLKTHATYCGWKPEKVTTVHVDDVSGLWVCQPRGKPIAMLSISPPTAIGAVRRVREIRQAVGLDALDRDEMPEPDHWVYSQPTVPIQQYRATLFLGLMAIETYHEPGGVADELGLSRGDPPSQHQVDRWLEHVLRDREQLQERTAALEAIRPEANELLSVHMKAVVYFRATYTIANLLAESLRQLALGNQHAARSHREEADSWQDPRLQARAELVDALHELSKRHNRLFAALGLSAERLEDLIRWWLRNSVGTF